MDSVKVGHDALLPKSKGLGSAFECLNNARSVTFIYVSIPLFIVTVNLIGMESPGVSWVPLKIACTTPVLMLWIAINLNVLLHRSN
jgi:hypothetical protein